MGSDGCATDVRRKPGCQRAGHKSPYIKRSKLEGKTRHIWRRYIWWIFSKLRGNVGFWGLDKKAAEGLFLVALRRKRLRASLRQGGSDLVATLTQDSRPGLLSFARSAGWPQRLYQFCVVRELAGDPRSTRDKFRKALPPAHARAPIRLRSGQAVYHTNNPARDKPGWGLGTSRN